MSRIKHQIYYHYWPIGLFAISLIVFMCLVFPHLSLPFFWDESWVYGPAVRQMAHDGLSILPDGLALSMSRGHPLLFHNIYGLWLQIFGNTIFNAHLLSLLISITFLCSLFYIAYKWTNFSGALLTCLYILLQQIFIAQSCLVLPEILLSLFLLWGTYFFIEKKWVSYFIIISLAFWIKESTLAFYGAFALISGIIFLKKPNTFKELSYTLLPGLSFVFFLLLNQKTYGWMLFPEHTDLMASDLKTVMNKLKEITSHLIIYESKFLYSCILIIGAILLAVQGKWKKLKDRRTQSLVLVMVFYIIFSSLNFYTVRYILPILALPAFLSIYYTQSWQAKWLYGVHLFVIVIFVWNLCFQKDNEEIRDVKISYVEYVTLKKQVVDYLEDQHAYDQDIRSGFLVYNALNQPLSGYRSTDQIFQKLNNYEEPISEKSYTVLNSVEPTDYLKDALGEGSTLLKSFSKGAVQIDVYLTQ